jgi:hypothetical protein
MSMKNSNDTIGNRTRDLPACSAVPQPTTPPCAPMVNVGRSSYIVPVIPVKILKIWKDFQKKFQTQNFMKIRSVEQKFFHVETQKN